MILSAAFINFVLERFYSAHEICLN